jgi:glycosyltransferase involved in cell wall biosynthesis
VRVSVIIPTYNEAASIGHVLDDLPAHLVGETVVVDSESTDRTREIAARRGARVIREPRRGYGRACLTGLAHVTHPDVVVFLDGDYSDRPAELPRILGPIGEGRADIVIGSRLADGRPRGALPWHSVLGNRIAARLIGLVCGVHLTDVGPFRAARYAALCALELEELTYGWPVEMIVKGASRGMRIVEVPVSYHPRIGTSKITGTLRGTIGAGWCMLTGIVKHRLRTRRPRRASVDPG